MKLYWAVITTTGIVNAIMIAGITPWLLGYASLANLIGIAFIEGMAVGILSGTYLVPLIERYFGNKRRYSLSTKGR